MAGMACDAWTDMVLKLSSGRHWDSGTYSVYFYYVRGDYADML